ncbi:hypothetical protein HKD37_16G045418 [Glycine soja]
MYSSMFVFQILKSFHIIGRPRPAPKVILVILYPPFFEWVKVNTNGATCGSPRVAACGGVFKDS